MAENRDAIWREDLLKQIDIDSKGNEGEYGDEWIFIDTIKALPSADVVEVVRCKECIYYTSFDESRPFDCSIGLLNAMPTDFCSNGERKDNE